MSIEDRATLSNMSPEYGATMGYFPVDEGTLKYLRQTGLNPLFFPPDSLFGKLFFFDIIF